MSSGRRKTLEKLLKKLDDNERAFEAETRETEAKWAVEMAKGREEFRAGLQQSRAEIHEQLRALDKRPV